MVMIVIGLVVSILSMGYSIVLLQTRRDCMDEILLNLILIVGFVLFVFSLALLV